MKHRIHWVGLLALLFSWAPAAAERVTTADGAPDSIYTAPDIKATLESLKKLQNAFAHNLPVEPLLRDNKNTIETGHSSDLVSTPQGGIPSYQLKQVANLIDHRKYLAATYLTAKNRGVPFDRIGGILPDPDGLELAHVPVSANLNERKMYIRETAFQPWEAQRVVLIKILVPPEESQEAYVHKAQNIMAQNQGVDLKTLAFKLAAAGISVVGFSAVLLVRRKTGLELAQQLDDIVRHENDHIEALNEMNDQEIKLAQAPGPIGNYIRGKLENHAYRLDQPQHGQYDNLAQEAYRQLTPAERSAADNIASRLA